MMVVIAENTFFAEFHRIYEFKILFFELFLTNVNKIKMLNLLHGFHSRYGFSNINISISGDLST